MPEGPAVAAWRALRRRADLMDGAFVAVHLDAAIGAHPRPVAPPEVGKGRPRLDEAVLDQCAKGHARGRLFRLHRPHLGLVPRQNPLDLVLPHTAIARTPVDARTLRDNPTWARAPVARSQTRHA